MSKCTNVLIQEHKLILRALYILDEIAARVERGADVERTDIESILQFLKLFADNRHQGKEESILFPALMSSRADTDITDVRDMVFEHNQERSLIEGMEDALNTKQGADFVYYENRIAEILRNHIQKEERVLFAIVDSSLSSSQDDALIEEFAGFDSSTKPEVIDALVRQLRDLEWRYLGRTADAASF